VHFPYLGVFELVHLSGGRASDNHWRLAKFWNLFGSAFATGAAAGTISPSARLRASPGLPHGTVRITAPIFLRISFLLFHRFCAAPNFT
jgi:hypothetical protein